MISVNLWVKRHVWIFTLQVIELNLNYENKDTLLHRNQLCTKNRFSLLTYLTRKHINVRDQVLNTLVSHNDLDVLKHFYFFTSVS